jgi:hypothetical protein
VEEGEAFDPDFAALFGAVGAPLEADGIAKLVEKFFGFWRG